MTEKPEHIPLPKALLMMKTMIACENPLAPIIIERAYASAEKLGQLMVGIKGMDPEKVHEIANKLISPWPADSELDPISRSPEFIIAVASLLCTSLVSWTESLPDIADIVPEPAPPAN